MGKEFAVSDDLSIPSPTYHLRRRGRGRMDPDTKRLLMIAGGLGAGLVVVFLASSLSSRHPGEIPVVQADSRPIKVKPENPGGLKVAGIDNEIFSDGSDTDGSKLAPPAETPDPAALRAPPPPKLARPPIPPTASAAIAAPLAAEPPPAVERHAAAVVPAVAKSAVAPARPAPAAIQPPAEKRPSSAVPGTEARGNTAQTGGKGAVVQLAALSSEDSARTEWQLLLKRMPELLNGRQPAFSRVERDGHTFWRVRTTGFADLAQAKTFCERIRAKGSGCSVADY
jgi:hypothetical protein